MSVSFGSLFCIGFSCGALHCVIKTSLNCCGVSGAAISTGGEFWRVKGMCNSRCWCLRMVSTALTIELLNVIHN